MKRLAAGLASVLAVVTLVPPAAAASNSPGASDYDRAYRIGLDAYLFGLPLLTTNRTFLTMTSTDVPQGAFGPANQFNNVRSPNTSSSTAVVAPGASSLSSIAWLELSSGPQVLHVPAVTGHSFVLALLDPYTTNLVNLGTASDTPAGEYVVRDPSQRGIAVPSGTRAIDVDYSRIWVIGSTQLLGPEDVPAVNAIQDQFTITPLDDFISGTTPTIPAPTQPTITQYSLPSGLAFFDTMGQLLQQFPPRSRDARAMRAFASVGIGPGLTPSSDADLNEATRQGLAAAVTAGPALVKKQTAVLFESGFTRNNGYLLGGFGRYGVDYAKRAVISQIGLGAFMPAQAIYAMTWTDRAKRPLDGSSRYVLHLQKPPPGDEGWSITVYNLQGGLISNAINRYAFTNSSPLKRNTDGSIDIYVQARAPRRADRQSNWLPVRTAQGFEIVWRLLAPNRSAIPGILNGTGWQPPAVSRARAATSAR